MTREEAIKIVKSATDYTPKETEALETLIPELRESEDERIRKHLVAIVEMYWGKTNDPDKAKDLAYLEKQKEQKPVEWSFPYGVNETVDKLIAIAECLEMDGDCLFNGHTGTECGKFLRDFARKQVECKPTEWSEEDKERIQRIHDFMWKNRKGDTDTIYQIEKDADWLKSLRPSWKPSEEQMEILEKSVVGEVHHESDEHCWIDFDTKLLFDDGEKVRVLVLETI